jgi:hypothetical protein
LTALARTSPTTGPAVTFTGLIPDLDHYKGSFGGRVFPLWRDRTATASNVSSGLLALLSQACGGAVGADDVMAYIAAIAAHPGFIARFRNDFATPGIRIPLTADTSTFREAAELGRTVVWLHTFGERMADPKKGRPARPPRLPHARMPRVPAAGEIPQDESAMPDEINYDAEKKRLLIGRGYVEHVEPDMWNYEVSGKQVLLQWFSYRKASRERPLIGDRRRPSPLGEIQPHYWLSEYTTELINLLNVLGLLIDLEPAQAKLLERVCAGPAISVGQLGEAGELTTSARPKGTKSRAAAPGLFGWDD